MLNLKKIAVTGGIASGKSSVCRFLEEFGAYVVSADRIVHTLLSPQTSLGKKITELLGGDVVENHQFNRQAIAEKVFKNDNLLKKLEDLLHPEVQKEIEKQYQAFQKHPETHSRFFQKEPCTALFVAEVPLLYESNTYSYYDEVILVIADPELCQKRFENLRDLSSEEFFRRSTRLMSQEEKMGKAHRIIHNNGTLDDLRSSTKKLYLELTQQH